MSWSCEKKSLTSVMLFLCAVFLMAVFNACSESALDADVNEQDETSLVLQDESSSSVKSSSSKAKSSSSSKAKSSSSSAKSSSSSKLEYPDSFKPQDKEYPYAGIPRIVIETEYRNAVKDRETEVPAKMQIWGDSSAESEIMDLTIRGRGNSTWAYPKKPYTIKFEKKQSFLGLPEAKKWVMLANYRDRTLIRNAVAFELARKTSLLWTPRGKFADVYLNGKFLGNYYVCEKIEVKKNRLELGYNSYLLEFDVNYDEKFRFETKYNIFPVNIKYPSELDSAQYDYIKDYIDSTEKTLLLSADDSTYLNYVDQTSIIDYFIVYALSANREPMQPKSVYMYKENEGKLFAGPVWDFDYATFKINKSGLLNKDNTIFRHFFQKNSFVKMFCQRWLENRNAFASISSYVDSLSNYVKKSNEQNIKIWPIKINIDKIGDEEKTFDESIEMLKTAIYDEIDEIDEYVSFF